MWSLLHLLRFFHSQDETIPRTCHIKCTSKVDFAVSCSCRVFPIRCTPAWIISFLDHTLRESRTCREGLVLVIQTPQAWAPLPCRWLSARIRSSNGLLGKLQHHLRSGVVLPSIALSCSKQGRASSRTSGPLSSRSPGASGRSSRSTWFCPPSLVR